MTKWSDVGKGDVLQDKKGRVFTVEGKTGDDTFVLKDADGKVYPIRNPSGTVTRLLSRNAALEQAVALAQVRLGGRIHTAVEAEGDEPYRCPVDFIHPGDLAAHIYVMHGIKTEHADFGAMVKQHVELHHPNHRTHGHVEHVHDPNFVEYLRRMTTDAT